jgi:dynein heavy chain
METIFMHILKGFLADSPHKGLDKLAPSIVKTTVDMYLRLKEKFLPTPKKSHYTFNLRDISKVF